MWNKILIEIKFIKFILNTFFSKLYIYIYIYIYYYIIIYKLKDLKNIEKI